jgi:hypothetical protein
MEQNLASKLSGKYLGNMVYSASRKVVRTYVEVVRLNHIIVKVLFSLEGREFVFRAMLSEQEEGLLMIIQDRVTKDHILSGVSGFLYQKPNVHGGYIHKLNSFYFHIRVKGFEGDFTEVYFMGKEELEYQLLDQKRSQDILKVKSLS